MSATLRATLCRYFASASVTVPSFFRGIPMKWFNASNFALSSFALAAISLQLGAGTPGRLLLATDSSLANSWGQGCGLDCQVTFGGCTGSTGCVASGAAWAKVVGTNATPIACVSATPGGSTCNSNTPVDCFIPYTCTDNKCTNCTAKTPTKVNSVCRVGGTYCGS